MVTLGKIEEVSLRAIWPREDTDFTPWLAKPQNLELLGDELALGLVDAEVEVAVGSFSCDIKCKVEGDGRIVAIENELESSDHDHLGKCIVYASGINASIIIWIVKNARPEHASAIEWLNEHSDSDIGFFLVELRAVKIGSSAPAPLFNIIAKPNSYMKSVKGNPNKELTRIQAGRYEFWSQMNEYIEKNSVRLRKRKLSYDYWYDFAIGSSLCHLTVNLLDKENRIRVGLWISDSKEIYDKLWENREVIERSLGQLQWDRKDDAKASWVVSYINGFSFNEKDNWPDFFQTVCGRLVEFQKVMSPLLK